MTIMQALRDDLVGLDEYSNYSVFDLELRPISREYVDFDDSLER